MLGSERTTDHLKHNGVGKAPGTIGLAEEFYKFFWQELREDLVEDFVRLGVEFQEPKRVCRKASWVINVPQRGWLGGLGVP
ncbi:uncharacterized [Tachysurus ichikawai]